MDRQVTQGAAMIENRLIRLEVGGGADCFWSYTLKESGKSWQVKAPVLELDGVSRIAELGGIAESSAPVKLRNGCTEYRYAGHFIADEGLHVELVFRLSDDNPVVRFHYRLYADTPRRLTKSGGKDALNLLSVSFGGMPQVTEIRFSEFNEMVHSFCLSEIPVERRQFENGSRIMGPMVTGSDGQFAMLAAYEHGSQAPDAFLTYRLTSGREAELHTVKGSYVDGQPIGPERSYETVWMQMAAVEGGEDQLAEAYREFVLRYMSVNTESRKPYIFYNTWAYQERNKWWNGGYYLDSMHQEHLIREIEIAHRMGIEVFVIDTGWYERTGDWAVNLSRFPDGLKSIKAKLDEYGMKLGLWFGPTSAAVSSRAAQENRDCIQSWQGKVKEAHPVWETEDSYPMCLVSRFSDAFIAELIRLVREVGVTYFKWDAIQQYGCDSADHWHGDGSSSAEERADSYAFQLGLQMSRIVDAVSEACPDVIVDFDITEGHRYVGLGFLSSGKYFLINNGPYYDNYDIPIPDTQWTNMFVHAGPARGWVCRTPLGFDKWIPSVLFLTHYLPDDPGSSQENNIASLILGHNGIWGDLLNVSEEGIRRFHQILGLYKQVRDDITASSPVRYGAVGGTPEIYEKISGTGRGAVVVFANAAGAYQYVTQHCVDAAYWHNEGVAVSRDGQERAVLEMTFDRPGAKIVFFGIESSREAASAYE
jgi:alpha-galactosidase